MRSIQFLVVGVPSLGVLTLVILAVEAIKRRGKR